MLEHKVRSGDTESAKDKGFFLILIHSLPLDSPHRGCFAVQNSSSLMKFSEFRIQKNPDTCILFR
ncbi:MAG: hypothetical protein EBR40_01345 [Proteobacteria bacterium]|nr:hypothetical protein [Pseudomonadota bacterium]